MNNSFSLIRIGNLFKKQTSEHFKNYLMSISVLVGLLIMSILFSDLMNRKPLDVYTQFEFFLFFFLLGGALFTSSIFAEMGTQRNAIAALTLPASTFEKYFVKWFLTLVIYPMFFVTAFYFVLVVIQNIFRHSAEEVPIINIFHHPDTRDLFLDYILLHAVSIWGSLYFKKAHFVKTMFAAMVAFILFSVANLFITSTMLGVKIESAVPFGAVDFFQNNKIVAVQLQAGGGPNPLTITVGALAIIFWTAAYFRLKEKQV